jgi:hypothetical protein
VACGASPARFGVIDLGIVKDARQVAAMERTIRAGAVDYGRRKLTVNLK